MRESLKKVIKASDHISTDLELLEILPCDQMGQLLEEELLRRGFEREDEKLVRKQNGLTVTIDPTEGTVTVQSEADESLELAAEREGRVYDDMRKTAEKRVREELAGQMKEDLEKQATQRKEKLQEKVTEKLEAGLNDLQGELGQVVNRVTAEALKRKAAQLGQIKELTEDPESGSMTIVLEV